jgi:hypothetical protein
LMSKPFPLLKLCSGKERVACMAKSRPKVTGISCVLQSLEAALDPASED